METNRNQNDNYTFDGFKELFELIKQLDNEQIERFFILYRQEVNEECELPSELFLHQAD